jgi:hypothetical protein
MDVLLNERVCVGGLIDRLIGARGGGIGRRLD